MSELKQTPIVNDVVQHGLPDEIDPETGALKSEHKPDDSGVVPPVEFKLENYDDLINNLIGQYNKAHTSVEKLEEEFRDTKLNPYGVTEIDFSKRTEQQNLMLKLEGGIDALNLAKETFKIDDTIELRDPNKKYT